mgnify:CR=1 FL=1
MSPNCAADSNPDRSPGALESDTGQRWAACVEYCGRAYSGWQRQVHSPSVQARVETALTSVADHPVQVQCAGRTDTGVHGLGQIVHFDSRVARKPHNWLLGANSCLPDDIALNWVVPVDEEFHARFSALSRTYRYFFLMRPVRSAHLAGMVTHIRDESLDLDAMQSAFSHCLGEMDFSSFRGAGCQSNSPFRNLSDARVIDHGSGLIELRVQANAFLLHMVRNLAGALLEVGRSSLTEKAFQKLLQAKDRRLAPATAAPDGLYLWRVEYPAKYRLPEGGSLPLLQE